MIIRVDKNPYDVDENLYSYTKVDFPVGLTVLVGRNGSGKTTLLNYVESQCDKEVNAKNNTTIIKYNNYLDGGSNSLSNALFNDDMSKLANLTMSSEGQRIGINIGDVCQEIGATIHNSQPNSRLVVLFDAVDSGLSIDTIVDLKDVFNMIIEDASAKNIEVFIIVSANGYELANGSRCLDVSNGEFITFADYDEYKNFILTNKTK